MYLIPSKTFIQESANKKYQIIHLQQLVWIWYIPFSFTNLPTKVTVQVWQLSAAHIRSI